jgi:hypothetical protein
MLRNVCAARPQTTQCHSQQTAASTPVQLHVTRQSHNSLPLFTMLFDHPLTGGFRRTAHVGQEQPFLPDRCRIIWISVRRARLSGHLYQGHSLPRLDHI